MKDGKGSLILNLGYYYDVFSDVSGSSESLWTCKLYESVKIKIMYIFCRNKSSHLYVFESVAFQKEKATYK